MQDGSFKRGEDCHKVLQVWCGPKSDWNRHSIRRPEVVHCQLHAVQRLSEEGSIQGHRSSERRRVPRTGEGLHHLELCQE